MNLKLQSNYWDNPRLKEKFQEFLRTIFNFELTLWDQKGFWDYKYQPFSYFDGDKMVASLCIYSLDMVVKGKRRQIAQVSAVGTLPEYRRQGINSELTRIALEWAEPNHDFFFLFADKDAQPFYRENGFRHVDEHITRINVEGQSPKAGIRKLDIGNNSDLAFIYRHASERSPVSKQLGVLNEKLFMFWCLYYLRDNVHFIDDLKLLVLYKREGSKITVYDIVGKRIPAFSKIYPYLAQPEDRTVEFRFMTDKLKLDNAEHIKLSPDNGLHLMGDFPLENQPFIFPCTSQA